MNIVTQSLPTWFPGFGQPQNYLLQWFFQNLCIHVTRIKPFISFLKCESFHDMMKWEKKTGKISCESWIYPKLAHLSLLPVVEGSLISREPKWIKEMLGLLSFPTWPVLWRLFWIISVSKATSLLAIFGQKSPSTKAVEKKVPNYLAIHHQAQE